MDISISQVIATIINFVLTYFILRHLLFKPITKAIEDRENLIEGRIIKSEEDMKEAQKLKMENQQLLKDSKNNGKAVVEKYKEKAELVSTDIISESQKEAQVYMNRARIEIEREKEKAQEELKIKVVDLAIMISSKALGESIDEKTHRKLIEDFIAEVGV